MREPYHLLVDALVKPVPEAAGAWRLWRSSINLDRLDAGSFWMLPALTERMQDWIADDPQREILVGICRRAWTQHQMARRLAAEAVESMRNAGVERVALTGPWLWTLLYWPSRAPRPADSVDLLLEAVSVRPAVEALARSGWSVRSRLPDWDSSSFYFAPAIVLQSSSSSFLRLHWRELPNTDFALRRPPPPSIDWTRDFEHRHRPSAGKALVAALGGDCDGGIPWQCDAVMILREPGLDWPEVAHLLRWRSRAKARLDQLIRHWDIEIPHHIAKELQITFLDQVVVSPLRYYRLVKSMIRRSDSLIV